MFNINTNSKRLADKYRKRSMRIKGGARAGLARIAQLIDREQVKNLRGGADVGAGAYPIPIRSSDLFQGHFWMVKNEKLAIVGNTSGHAIVVHEGLGSSAIHGPRRFLADAVDKVDAVNEFADEFNRHVFAI